ncbi:hypothetical protein J7I93_22870 [Bacillus sp. ISL-47]|uniref:hypothetical protein n=1 Tax=Bacillus sp. ISL-47 TaxID=2819130 RepID=UPI001BEB0479|nr:hypothetical protein [Bacillus sp. ISL-47]MBT2690983.1 hypothetical protein [Bacillus sp. ISL-47]MBT2710402.1 hypothetical protein [Pseudomonas sp. ISL-84]
MKYLTKSMINNLQYNRRLQECCFLLRKKYHFSVRLPLKQFWDEREIHYFDFDKIPQTRSCLEYDLKRICLLCSLNPNLNNYLLIFTFSHYGVWRTTRWLQKKELREDNVEDLQITAAFKTINYLYSLILSARIHVDPLVDIYIENKVFKKIKENNWGNPYIEKPSEKNELKNFLFQTTHTLPLEIANISEAMDQENYGDQPFTEQRYTETKRRNYYFWRWSKRGFTLFEMGQKWNELKNNVNDDYERALIDDKVNKGLKSYISTHGPLFEHQSTIGWFKHFLNYYSEKEAAERVFEMAARSVSEILEREVISQWDNQ